jgi:hypothetical protein
VVVLLLLALGAGVAVGIGQSLGISYHRAEQMHPPAPDVPAVAPSAVNPRLLVRAPRTVRLRVAVQELRSAQRQSRTRGRATLTVVVGRSRDAQDDTYRLGGTPGAMTIRAAGETGAVRGVYDLAGAARSGRSVTEDLGRTVSSRLPFRMVDLGAVGVTPVPAQWRSGIDYSHASRAFENAYLPTAPYVDQRALAADFRDWEAFLRQSLANGYNAVAWPGFIEFTDFAGAPDGPVYAPGDPHVARAAALRRAFTPFWERARQLGVRVYLRTDMLALTPALKRYFERTLGGLPTTDPRLWRVYTEALERLYHQVPGLSGVMIRVGEGGSIYAEPGWDYYSELAVRTVPAVRSMLTAFTRQAERSGREVVFRTWSVGIGAVGDMHTDPASYEKVLGGLDSPALIVSTKYAAGDFYSWLPLNKTLETGGQRRIVEFQSRREFEGFGAFPNDLGPEFSWAMQQLLAENPRIEGVWSWTQDGGPWRAGPMTLYLKTGFWPLYEQNNRIAAALARDPAADVGQLAVDWVRTYLSEDPATVRAVVEALTLSRQAITKGLYLRPFAEQSITALGLEPPPQMWLFEWDILTGDSGTLDLSYAVVRDRLAETIADGQVAVDTARRMRALVAGTDVGTWRTPRARADLIAALDYEVNTLRLLAAYRTMFLRAAQWHDTGSSGAYAAWRTAHQDYERRAAEHLRTYGGDVLHPAWNLAAARLGVERAERDRPMAWAARALLVLALGWLALGLVVPAARATWVGATRPWRSPALAGGLSPNQRVLAVAVPTLLVLLARGVQTAFLAPSQLLVTLGATGLFALAAVLLRGRASAWSLAVVLAGVSLLRCMLALVALSTTGPGGYWFAFWTEPGWRGAYVTVAFALFCWLFVAAGWTLAGALGGRRATGAVLAGVGLGLGGMALFVASYGLERALTVWNDQMGLLPWGLARILGITTYLEIPPATAWWAAAAGGVVLGVGLVLRLVPRRAARQLSRRTAPGAAR